MRSIVSLVLIGSLTDVALNSVENGVKVLMPEGAVIRTQKVAFEVAGIPEIVILPPPEIVL